MLTLKMFHADTIIGSSNDSMPCSIYGDIVDAHFYGNCRSDPNSKSRDDEIPYYVVIERRELLENGGFVARSETISIGGPVYVMNDKGHTVSSFIP